MRTAVTCIVVAGDGPMSTRWLKDDMPLDEKMLDATIIPAEDGFVSTITIKSLSNKHNGNYTCLATNDVATGSYSSVLTVKGKGILIIAKYKNTVIVFDFVNFLIGKISHKKLPNY